MATDKLNIAKTSNGGDFSLVEVFLYDKEAQARCLAHKLTKNDEANLRQAHKEITGHAFTKTCSNCYEDAFFKLLNLLKTKGQMGKYKMKNGGLIFVNDKPYTNANITDEVALKHFAECPGSKMFAVVPTKEELKAYKASVNGKAGADALKAKKEAEEKAAKAAEANGKPGPLWPNGVNGHPDPVGAPGQPGTPGTPGEDENTNLD